VFVCGSHNQCTADFGLTIEYNAEHPGIGVAGSRFWMAPEMIMKMPYTCAIDIWAFGCVIFELFVGGPPYCQYDAIKAWFRTLTRGPQRLPASCKSTPQFQDFLDQCLCISADSRATATVRVSMSLPMPISMPNPTNVVYRWCSNYWRIHSYRPHVPNKKCSSYSTLRLVLILCCK
jgi:serine/threonine protein kinase